MKAWKKAIGIGIAVAAVGFVILTAAPRPAGLRANGYGRSGRLHHGSRFCSSIEPVKGLKEERGEENRGNHFGVDRGIDCVSDGANDCLPLETPDRSWNRGAYPDPCRRCREETVGSRTLSNNLPG